MGYELVKVALSPSWAHLPYPARIVLAAMANMALDSSKPGQPAGRYFGGVEYLAQALGYRLELVGEPPEWRAPEPARHAVARAISTGTAAGAVQIVVRPAPGRRGEYQLTLDRPPLLADSRAERMPVMASDEPGTDAISGANGCHLRRDDGQKWRDDGQKWRDDGQKWRDDGQKWHAKDPTGTTTVTEEESGCVSESRTDRAREARDDRRIPSLDILGRAAREDEGRQAGLAARARGAMTNRPRKIGTAAETAVVRTTRARGFPHAERLTLAGAGDRGDLTLCPGVVVEVKGGHTACNASDRLVEAWLAETAAEQARARADIAFLVTQRAGVGLANAHRWWAWWRLSWLPTQPEGPAALAGIPVRMTLCDALTLLRAHGWGHPLEEDPTAAISREESA